MVEETLVAVLRTACARVYPDFAPTGTVKPYVTWQQVGGKPIQYVDGASGTGLARFQINVWATTRQESITLIRQIETLMANAPLSATIEGGAVATLDDEQLARGAMQDFTIQY